MSFVLTNDGYKLLGIELPESSASAELIYTVLDLFSLSNSFATVDFGVYLPDGTQLAFRQFGFDHSGTEDEAMYVSEEKLKAYLEA
ncbi:hypothetical protein JGY86_07350 [Raoultella sp. XY-1]|uniref:hypothetical protein n=1 Tax=Raoultella sp. XY-1 TaxID=2799495 RepID=UPI00190332CF|nr:hypothetical protein [Raoultella sp. XY-1]QQN44926.1 hypothetical protein JGY86_07350 [Raoultella sp. XY-1]